MKLRHILEYEDHEIMDLLGDLETVGHTEKRVYHLWVYFKKYHTYLGNTNDLSLRVCRGELRHCLGELDRDKPAILSSLQKGDFTRPKQGALEWDLLTGRQSHDSPERKDTIEAMELLDLEPIQKFFDVQQGNLDDCLLALKKELEDWIGENEVAVGIVYDLPNEPSVYWPPEPLTVRNSLISGDGVFYEDHTGKEKIIEYPFKK